MGSYHFDYSAWPIVYFTADGSITHPQLEAHLKETRALLDRNQPYVIIIDTTNAGNTDAYLRKRYAEFLRDNASDYKRYCKAAAVIITSPIVRGTVTAVLWLTELPFHYKIFSNSKEATDWIKTQL